MTIPARARYLVVGGRHPRPLHAWHLAQELEARGFGSGEDVVVVKKSVSGPVRPGLPVGEAECRT